MEISLTSKPGNTIGGRRLAVRVVGMLIMFAGVGVEWWVFTQVHAELAERGLLMWAGVPLVWLGGVIVLRWGLSRYEIDRLPSFLRRFAR